MERLVVMSDMEKTLNFSFTGHPIVSNFEHDDS